MTVGSAWCCTGPWYCFGSEPPILLRNVRKWSQNEKCCHFLFYFLIFTAHLAKGPIMFLCREMMSCCIYAFSHRVSAVYYLLHTALGVCVHACVWDSQALHVQVNLWNYVIFFFWLHLPPFFPGCVSCLIKVNPVRWLLPPPSSIHPLFVSPSPISLLLHPFVTQSQFSFLQALWQHRRMCTLKVPPSPSSSHGWCFLGNRVRVDWVGADRWLPFIRLHHRSIKSNPGVCVSTRAPLGSQPKWTVPPDTREYYFDPGWGCVCVCLGYFSLSLYIQYLCFVMSSAWCVGVCLGVCMHVWLTGKICH